MDSKETAQMMLSNILEVKDTLSTLNERSKNYYDMLKRQDEKIQENGSQIKDITHRVEKIEIALANIDVVKEHTIKIEELTTELVSVKPEIKKIKQLDNINKDITILKRDRWWIGTLAGVIGSFIGFVFHLIFCK